MECSMSCNSFEPLLSFVCVILRNFPDTDLRDKSEGGISLFFGKNEVCQKLLFIITKESGFFLYYFRFKRTKKNINSVHKCDNYGFY